MRDIVRWGVVIGLVSAGVAWLGESLSSSKGVSLSPDLLSLIAWLRSRRSDSDEYCMAR
jgi:hypothetical protein